MSTSDESPVISFLRRKENLLPALEIISRGPEIRSHVKKQFWDKIEGEIKKSRPQDLNLRFLWDRKEIQYSFLLYARLSPIDKKSSGIQYAIEAHRDYYGIGFRWIKEPEKNFEKLLRLPLVNALHQELTKTRQGEVDSESNDWWLWWEYWEKSPFDDPWIWFVKKSIDASFLADTAKKFWDFARPTYAQVLRINEAAKH